MIYRLKHFAVFTVAATLAIVGVMAKNGVFSGANLPQMGESWIGYTLGLPLFSIVALLSFVKIIRGKPSPTQEKEKQSAVNR
ncbi:hypothetical protein DMW15_22505 [Vibrio parahaemolyticus]|nr:hypothetical protein [Vibrio parahaemolyticus]